MKKMFLPLLGAAAIALSGTGCTTTETGALEPQNTDKFDVENRAKFVLMDPGAQKSVTVSVLQEKALSDGRLEVAANVRNRENRRIQVQVQCEFKDEQGFAIDSTPWQNVMLTENGQETLRWAAMSPQAKRYTIRVRQAR
jgi:uncharacterized protein YcfL